MNLSLAKAAVAAITDDELDAGNPNYPTDPGVERKGLCSRFARCATRKAYKQKYQGLFGATAAITGRNMREAGFATTGQPEPGDFLVKLSGAGGAGHIGIYVGALAGDMANAGIAHSKDLIAENSSTAIGRISGAKGYRTLKQFGNYDLLLRLPPSAQPEKTFRLFLNDHFLTTLPIRHGRAYCKAATWAQALGLELNWDKERAMISLDGRTLPSQTSIFTQDGRAFVWIGDLVRFSGLQVTVDDAERKITVFR